MEILTDTVRTHLKGFVNQTCYLDVTTTRQVTLRRLIRNNFFWQGYHYIAPSMGAHNRTDWTPVNGNTGSGYEGGPRAYTNSLNFYKGDAKKLIGVLGRTPNAEASAIHQRDDEAVNEAEDANKLLDELRWHWDVEVLNSYLVFYLWTCGPVYGYTPYGADARRFGTTKIPKFRMETVEVEPGYFEDIPVQDGYDEFANGSVSLILATDYDIIKPSRMKSLDGMPWFIYEHEVHEATLISTYPEILQHIDKIRGGNNPYDPYGRTARDQAASSAAYNRPQTRYYWTESLVWLTPSMYDMMPVENEALTELAKQLKVEHPDGAKIVMINGYPIRIESESLHEVWFECPSEVGHSLDEPALGDETARLNRAIDDTYNVLQETAEMGNPITFYDPQVIDPNTLSLHPSTPVNYMPVLPGQGGDIRKSVYASDPVEMSPHVIQLMETAKQAMRENSGITPALSGSETKQQTLGEAEINRNMALLPHNVTWNFIRRFWAGVYTNGVRQLAKYGVAKAYFGGSRNSPVKEVEIPRLRNLLRGNWKIECEEAIPMTWGQIRAQMIQLMDRGPEAWAMVGLNDPRNVKAFLKCLGNRDFIVPGEKQRDKTLADIAMLLREQPVQQFDPMTGQPMMVPSRPADEFEDDHMLVVQIVREWAIDDSGRLEKTGNPGGYANVILWAKEHQAMAAPPPMPGEEGGAPPLGPPPLNDFGTEPANGLDPNSQLVPEELAGMALEGA